VPEAGKIQLSIYNITGKEEAVLYDGYIQAGNKSFNFDASQLSSGIYFCKLAGGGEDVVKKLVLVK